MPIDQLIYSTLSLYLVGFFVLLVCREKLLKSVISSISIGLNLIGLLIFVLLVSGFQQEVTFSFDWANLAHTSFSGSILINKLTLLLWGLVQVISISVQLFSTKYMAEDDRFGQYYAYLNLFIFSMLGLVCSGNLLFIFIFWELVGFCSYLLIGFWYKKQSATNASLKAFIVNRIGDAGFLIGIGLVYFQFQTLEIAELALAEYIPTTLFTLTGLMLFCGCIGKSAQFPLQVWLPDAMEGPTPVSALIHAATMVAAGIFLLARIDFIFTPFADQVIALTGALTALLAAYSAIFQKDIKKVLAYSTVSQLGLMVMAIGAGGTNAALFHLFTHGFFKAGLFLIAGAIIHHFHHEQNMFRMGGLMKQKPILTVFFGICGASLVGLPLFSGFLSKDAVLLTTWNWATDHQNTTAILIPILGTVASVLTAYYMMRAFVLIFLQRESKPMEEKSKSQFSIFEWSILPLAVCSLWFVFGSNPMDFERNYFSNYFSISQLENHWIGYLVLIFSLLALMFSYFSTKKEINNESSELTFWRKLGLNHFYLDRFYEQRIAKAIAGELRYFDQVDNTEYPSGVLHNQKGFSKKINTFDRQVIDGSISILSSGFRKMSLLVYAFDEKLIDGLVKLIYTRVSKIGDRLKTIQGGKIQSYLIALILFFLAIMILLILL